MTLSCFCTCFCTCFVDDDLVVVVVVFVVAYVVVVDVVVVVVDDDVFLTNLLPLQDVAPLHFKIKISAIKKIVPCSICIQCHFR